jgi:hypothetical protein
MRVRDDLQGDRDLARGRAKLEKAIQVAADALTIPVFRISACECAAVGEPRGDGLLPPALLSPFFVILRSNAGI